jgi:hypothetical protein
MDLNATPAERSRAATKASLMSWGNTEDRTARTAPGRRRFEQRFLDQAKGDPKRAAALRRAYFMDLTEKSIKARKRRQAAA